MSECAAQRVRPNPSLTWNANGLLYSPDADQQIRSPIVGSWQVEAFATTVPKDAHPFE